MKVINILLLVVIVTCLLQLLDLVLQEFNLLFQLLKLLSVRFTCVLVRDFPLAIFNDELDVVLWPVLEAG